MHLYKALLAVVALLMVKDLKVSNFTFTGFPMITVDKYPRGRTLYFTVTLALANRKTQFPVNYWQASEGRKFLEDCKNVLTDSEPEAVGELFTLVQHAIAQLEATQEISNDYRV